MSDEAQDTPAAATKSLFGALAFILLLLGAEMISGKGWPQVGYRYSRCLLLAEFAPMQPYLGSLI